MVYASKRPQGRYTGYYIDALGARRSAGTFDTYEEAVFRAMDAERVPDRVSEHVLAHQTYAAYAATWLATESRILPQTLRGYESVLRKHVLPIMGKVAVGRITPATVKEMLKTLSAAGVSGWTLAQCKAAVGSSLKPLVPDVLPINPTHGVQVVVPPAAPFELVEPDVFQKIAKHLSKSQGLFASFLVLSGARFGEATEVRVRDLNPRTSDVLIMRRVAQLGSKRTGGSRYVAMEGTKAGRNRGRSVPLPRDFMTSLLDWAQENELQHDDLLFPKRLIVPDSDRETRVNVTGHLPNDRWNIVWKAAAKASGIGWCPRTHDLRHAYATHLVASGVSIYEVKELLGHRLIETTLRYQHRVAAQRSKAVEAASEFLP